MGSQAITTDLTKAERAKKGLKGGVMHMLYLCAFVVPVGKSLGEALLEKNELPPFIPVAVGLLWHSRVKQVTDSNQEDSTCTMESPAQRFYNDLPEREAKKWVSELRPQLAEAQLSPLTNAAYRFIPSTYLFCENDQALPIFLQKKMVAESGAKFVSEECTAGHSPFLSMPEKVVEAVEGIAKGAWV